MMEYEVKKYEKYKREIRFMLIGSGLWPDYKGHSRQFKTFLSALSAFSSAITTFTMANFCAHNLSSINVLTRGLGLCIGFWSIFLKVTILAWHREDMLSLNQGISARFEKDLQNPSNRPHLLAYFPSVCKSFNIFNCAVAMNVIQMSVTPLLALRHGKYARLYPQLMPFSFEPGGTIHWSIYGFELLNSFYLWSITVGVDSAFGYYALHMVGELRLLSSRFENLKTSKNYKKDLRECIERHQQLIEAQRLLEQVFGFLAIWLAVTCAVIICTIIFQISETKHLSAFRAVYLCVYVFIKFLQAYAYSWYGDIITVESKLCLNSIYNCKWPGSGDLQLMNDVLVIQSQNPLIFKAKGFVIVQLDMFSKILHTSVSYFFLLRTLDQTLEVTS